MIFLKDKFSHVGIFVQLLNLCIFGLATFAFKRGNSSMSNRKNMTCTCLVLLPVNKSLFLIIHMRPVGDATSSNMLK